MSKPNEGFTPDLISRIKAALKFSQTEPAAPAKPAATVVVKMEDVALKDGTILSVDSMAVGSNANFVGADGVAAPADGTFELPDGTMVICVAGKITEIKPAAAPAAETDMAAKLAAIEKRFTDLEGKFTLSQAANKNLETKLSATEKELAETKKGVSVALEAMEIVSKMPVAVSLESQLEANRKLKKYEDMTNHEKMLFNKGKL